MYLYTHVIAELRQRDEELKYTQEQSVTHKTTLQQQISERDTEIDKLRNQVSPSENLHVSMSPPQVSMVEHIQACRCLN